MNGIAEFQENHPSLTSYWRSIILFGNNVATYKFALAQTLLYFARQGKTDISLAELAGPYAQYLCEHLKHAPKQVTSSKSTFLDACKQFNEGQITADSLRNVTVAKGFNNVLDAFHVVNLEKIPVQFFEKDFSGTNKKIILTDDVFKLESLPFSQNLNHEVESRWNLVETAWQLGLSRNLLQVKYNDGEQEIYIEDKFGRKPVTSAKGALNGYQKGHCFYCFDEISIESGHQNSCDVDHFFPHNLQPWMPEVNLDGVWNLVLACPHCNRGASGKFAKVPAVKYLERLHKRNEFLISSHHPLRETIIAQTGITEEQRKNFLLNVDKKAIGLAIFRWDTEQIGQEVF